MPSWNQNINYWNPKFESENKIKNYNLAIKNVIKQKLQKYKYYNGVVYPRGHVIFTTN